MQNRLLVRSLLLFLITTCFALAMRTSSSETNYQRQIRRNTEHMLNQPGIKEKRAIGYSKKPGFIKTLFSVIYEQWTDTKKTYSAVSNMINDNFLPENPPPTTQAPISNDPNVTTTKAPYKITRTELGKILRRNLRGLVRLFNIELKDALKQSERNQVQFKKNASVEVSKFL